MNIDNVRDRDREVKPLYWGYLLVFLAVGIWSGIGAFDPVLWLLEAGMCVVGVVVLIWTYKRFPLTDITYFFILLHTIVLFIGAHYSYAEVPAFNWLRDEFGMARNNFDKVGHFMQGFVPAFIAREVLIGLKVINKKSWLPFLVVSICLAISAFYELIEWWVAVLSADGAEDFLGTQGYEWDTQSDMLMAMIGAICMIVLFSKRQDRQIEQLKKSKQIESK